MKKMCFCKRILLLLLLCIATTASAKVYIVSVGIADYPGDKSDLTLPVNDANAVAGVYEKYTDAEHTLLTNEHATKKNIKAAMESLFVKAKEDDVVIFFFSGHGNKKGFVAYDGNLSYSDVRDAMAKSKSKNKMIFADACHSGKLRTSTANQEEDDGEEEAARKANVMLFLSSRDDETSSESPSMTMGFFTTYLYQGLTGRADTDKNRIVTAKEIFNYVANCVAAISRDAQHPVMWGNFPDDMPVMDLRKKAIE